MSEYRFVYASYRTREKAESELFDMYACGDVFAAERPRIERRGKRWCITLPV